MTFTKTFVPDIHKIYLQASRRCLVTSQYFLLEDDRGTGDRISPQYFGKISRGAIWGVLASRGAVRNFGSLSVPMHVVLGRVSILIYYWWFWRAYSCGILESLKQSSFWLTWGVVRGFGWASALEYVRSDTDTYIFRVYSECCTGLLLGVILTSPETDSLTPPKTLVEALQIHQIVPSEARETNYLQLELISKKSLPFLDSTEAPTHFLHLRPLEARHKQFSALAKSQLHPFEAHNKIVKLTKNSELHSKSNSLLES